MIISWRRKVVAEDLSVVADKSDSNFV